MTHAEQIKPGRWPSSELDKLIGKKFGKLKIVGLSSSDKNKCRRVITICDCGKTRTVLLSALRYGHTKSCGCSRRTHHKTKTKIYAIWRAMLQRCYNKKSPAWEWYGARGIKTSKKWLNFENFYKDMGEKPDGMSLDRINNDGNYSKSNCRWATRAQQARNTRLTKKIFYLGQSKTAGEWAEEFGLKKYTVRNKLIAGWTMDEISTISKISHGRLEAGRTEGQ